MSRLTSGKRLMFAGAVLMLLPPVQPAAQPNLFSYLANETAKDQKINYILNRDLQNVLEALRAGKDNTQFLDIDESAKDIFFYNAQIQNFNANNEKVPSEVLANLTSAILQFQKTFFRSSFPECSWDVEEARIAALMSLATYKGTIYDLPFVSYQAIKRVPDEIMYRGYKLEGILSATQGQDQPDVHFGEKAVEYSENLNANPDAIGKFLYGSEDQVWLYSRSDNTGKLKEVWWAIRGSDELEDFLAVGKSASSLWTQFDHRMHNGLVAQLEPFLKLTKLLIGTGLTNFTGDGKMELVAFLSKVGSTPDAKIFLTGHSAGGAMAELLAVVLNKPGPPENRPLLNSRTIDRLYAFAPFPVTMDQFPEVRNSENEEGCFDGAIFYNTEIVRDTATYKGKVDTSIGRWRQILEGFFPDRAVPPSWHGEDVIISDLAFIFNMDSGFHHIPVNWVSLPGGSDAPLLDLSRAVATQITSHRFSLANRWKVSTRNFLTSNVLHSPGRYVAKIHPGYDKYFNYIKEGEEGFSETAKRMGNMGEGRFFQNLVGSGGYGGTPYSKDSVGEVLIETLFLNTYLGYVFPAIPLFRIPFFPAVIDIFFILSTFLNFAGFFFNLFLDIPFFLFRDVPNSLQYMFTGNDWGRAGGANIY